jgi:hypothetical protein
MSTPLPPRLPSYAAAPARSHPGGGQRSTDEWQGSRSLFSLPSGRRTVAPEANSRPIEFANPMVSGTNVRISCRNSGPGRAGLRQRCNHRGRRLCLLARSKTTRHDTTGGDPASQDLTAGSRGESRAGEAVVPGPQFTRLMRIALWISWDRRVSGRLVGCCFENPIRGRFIRHDLHHKLQGDEPAGGPTVNQNLSCLDRTSPMPNELSGQIQALIASSRLQSRTCSRGASYDLPSS